MELQKLLSYTRKAVDEYRMIEEGDHIAVGISGGKDSLTLLYAHHKDDIIETMLLSLIFEGRFYSFSPKTYLDRTDLTVIRPMMFVDEKDVIGFKNKYQLPVVKSKCPVDGYTKRQYVKELLRQLNHENPGVRERMFHAILDGNIEGWPERIIHPRA